MDKKKQLKHLWIAIGFFIIMSGVFAFLLFKIESNQVEYRNIQEQWDKERQKKEQIINLDKAIKSLGYKKDLLDSHFAVGTDIAPFLDSLEKTAESIGLDAEVITVAENASDETLSVALRTSGNFEQVYKFLVLLENFSYELEFDLVNIDRRGLGGDEISTPNWEALFRIRLISYIPITIEEDEPEGN